MPKITKLDMSAIMAQYTAQVMAEHQRAQEIRQGLRPAPQQGTWGTWQISDRD